MKLARLSCIALAACGGSLLSHPTPSGDREVVAAAEVAGNTSAGLEVTMVGVSLLTDLPTLPGDPTGLAGSVLGVLDDLFGSCVHVSPAGDGLAIALAEGGCGIPKTDVRLEGSFSLRASSGGYALAFAGLRIGGVTIDGELAIAVLGDRRVHIDGSIDASYAGRAFALSIRGDVATNRSHSSVRFTGEGELRLGGAAWAFTAHELDRHLVADCYPKSGTLELRQTAGGAARMRVGFDDSQLGLDSDDTGLVRIEVDGAAATVAQLPGRSCVGL